MCVCMGISTISIPTFYFLSMLFYSKAKACLSAIIAALLLYGSLLVIPYALAQTNSKNPNVYPIDSKPNGLAVSCSYSCR